MLPHVLVLLFKQIIGLHLCRLQKKTILQEFITEMN